MSGPMSMGERVAAAARAVVGARFRAQGRDPASGLDCVDVAAWAVRSAGFAVAVPGDYALRSSAAPCFASDMMIPCDGDRAGDVLLCRAAAGQLHVAVRTAAGFVHADLSLRRVVERPGAVPWPIAAAWRVVEEG